MFAGCGEQVLAALQSPGNPAVWETSAAYMKKQSKLALFLLGDNNFAAGQKVVQVSIVSAGTRQVLHTAGFP